MKLYAKPALAGAAEPALGERAIARLVEDYLPLAVKQADRVWLAPRLGLTRDDMISAGCYGLLLAARRFDPARGVGFGVFARAHVHGALMREINTARKACGIADDETFVGDGELVEPDSLPDPRGEAAVARSETAQVRNLMECILAERERLQLTLYYFEELTLAEVAAVVGDSERAVARTLKAALAKLKAALIAEAAR